MPSSFSCICHCCLLEFECRWRHNRPGVLTDTQYQEAKEIALSYIPRFFPGNTTKPVFVPLTANVATKLNDIQEELKDGHPPPAADEKVPGAPAEEADHPRPHDPEIEAEHHAKRARAAESALGSAPGPSPARPPALPFQLDVDAGIDVKEEGEEKDHDLQWELRNWFSPASPSLLWNDPASQPSVTWKRDQVMFPRLSLLARRFLCVLPTSAPSERVWSCFGHIISKQSASIDSTIAAQTMFLRYNHDIVDQIPPGSESQ